MARVGPGGTVIEVERQAVRQQEIHAERDGSYRERENSGRYVGSRLREEQKGPISGQPIIEEVAAAES